MAETRIRLALCLLACSSLAMGYLAGTLVTWYVSGRYWQGQVDAMQAGIDALEASPGAPKHAVTLQQL